MSIKKIAVKLYDLLRLIKYSNPFLKNHISILKNNAVLRILGNGDSINDVELSTDAVDYMVVNRHVIAHNYVEIQPKYYMLADPYFFDCEAGISVLKQINQITQWNMIVFLPYRRSYVKKMLNLFDNSNIRVQFYNSCPYDVNSYCSSYIYNHQLAMPAVQNVLVACIMMGIQMKYSRIELYGVEHNWLPNITVSEDNVVYMKDTHFYDKELGESKKHLLKIDYPLGEWISFFAQMFKSYMQIKQYVDESQIQTKIVNKTKGSFIDAFERE